MVLTEPLTEAHTAVRGSGCSRPRRHHRCARSVHEFSVKDFDGHMICLDKYKGFVCVVTNVASQ
ncbi:hypothetical protein U0070_023888 [Myodes glareolus]|uniref:Uncharacterized protein n=1 Tax=Myodes glareolus TaxID=447135 RepID=A0AAW0HW16_MYOGA